jgi:hypothetical protein
MWRFLSNPRVTPKELAQPLRKAAHEAVARQLRMAKQPCAKIVWTAPCQVAVKPS